MAQLHYPVLILSDSKKSRMFSKKSLGFFETIYVCSAENLLKAEIIFNFNFILLKRILERVMQLYLVNESD